MNLPVDRWISEKNIWTFILYAPIYPFHPRTSHYYFSKCLSYSFLIYLSEYWCIASVLGRVEYWSVLGVKGLETLRVGLPTETKASFQFYVIECNYKLWLYLAKVTFCSLLYWKAYYLFIWNLLVHKRWAGTLTGIFWGRPQLIQSKSYLNCRKLLDIYLVTSWTLEIQLNILITTNFLKQLGLSSV